MNVLEPFRVNDQIRRPAKGLRPSIRRWLSVAYLRRSQILVSGVVGLLAATGTYLALAQIIRADHLGASAGTEPTTDFASSEVLSEDAAGTGAATTAESALDADRRIVAVPRRSAGLTIEVGDRVELVGLRPSPDSVEVTTLASDAVVIEVTDQSVSFIVSVETAHEVTEVLATGTVEFLGRPLAKP